MVAGDVGQIGGEAAARAEAATDPLDDDGAHAVVADEGDVAAARVSGRRLAEVVEECSEAHGPRPIEAVGQRFGQQRGHLARVAAHVAAQVGLDLQPPDEHLHGVAMDVEVVVRVLLDAPEARELG